MTELCHKQSVALLAAGKEEMEGWVLSSLEWARCGVAGDRESRVGSAGMRGFDYL